jgi:hypothetical protein
MCFVASPAYAVCTTASLKQDYHQADLVVRAVVTAETRVADDEPNAAFKARWGSYSPVTLHKLRIVETFKGEPRSSVNLFETVDSGRFGVDLGEEYLLFFSYYPSTKAMPSIARGATFIRHTCGQSKRWKTIAFSEARRLRVLERAR